MNLFEFCWTLGHDDWMKHFNCSLKIFIEPTICVIGFLVNTFCLLLFVWVNWRHKNTHSELLPYLAALCFFDATQNILSILVLDVHKWATYRQTLYPNQPEVWVPWMNFSSLTLRFGAAFIYTANYGSIWTITAIAYERHRAICNPWTTVGAMQHAQNTASGTVTGQDYQSSRTRAWVTVAFIFSLATLLNVIRWFESWLDIRYTGTEGGNMKNLSYWWPRPSPFSYNYFYMIVMNKVIYTLLLYVIPFIILVALNLHILYELYAKAAASNQPMTFRARHRELRSAWMLLTIIALFFLCHTGGLILRWVPTAWIHENYDHYIFYVDIANFLFNVNSMINPIIYFLFTRKFKDFWRLQFRPPAQDIKASAKGIRDATAAALRLMSINNASQSTQHRKSILVSRLNVLQPDGPHRKSISCEVLNQQETGSIHPCDTQTDINQKTLSTSIQLLNPMPSIENDPFCANEKPPEYCQTTFDFGNMQNLKSDAYQCGVAKSTKLKPTCSAYELKSLSCTRSNQFNQSRNQSIDSPLITDQVLNVSPKTGTDRGINIDFHPTIQTTTNISIHVSSADNQTDKCIIDRVISSQFIERVLL